MKQKQEYIQEFEINTSGLSTFEKKVLEKLVAAAKLVAPVYKNQINDNFPGANFYPHDATKGEIEEAANQNPQILDPYTLVERKNGKLVAVPYHVKYREALKPIVKILKEAAEISPNRHFARRLVMQANTLLDGTYEAADIYWLSMEPYTLNILLAPQERYEDRLFFIKNCYTAVVGIIDKKRTENASKLKDMIIAPKKRLLYPTERIEFLDKMRLRVDNIAVMAGLDARSKFSAADFPNDPNLMEKHGATIVVYGTVLDERFENEFYPIFNAVFAEEFQKRYTKDLLKEASLNYVLLHEIGHALNRYRDAEERLKELFPVIDELTAYIVGIKSFWGLLLKGIISQKQLEALFSIFITRCFSWWLDAQKNKAVEAYARGHALALNYFFDNGAISESSGISWPNFTKMYVGFSDLADVLERFLAIGEYRDVKYFFNKFATYDSFLKFERRLTAPIKES